MIKHIVMWKLKDFAEENSKDINAKKIKEGLESLKGKIEGLQDIEVGININKGDQAYDVVLYSEFKTEDDLGVYQNHPEHLKIAAGFIRKVYKKRVVVDYQV